MLSYNRTSGLKKLVLVLCTIVALFTPFYAKLLEGGTTCPCPGISGPSSTCPNVQQTIFVTNAPAGSVISFSTSNGNIVSQSGTSAIINQPGLYTATVCFPLNINIPQGANCGVNCNNPLVTASLSSNIAGNPSSITICQTGTSPSSVVLTCNTNVAVNPGTTTYRFFNNGVLVANSASNTLTVNTNSFSGTIAAYTCQAVTQSNQCVSPTSNTITIIKCSGGGGLCPTVVTLTSQGSCPSFTLRASVNNPQPNTIYTFTLRRSTGGPFSTVSIQVVGPFTTVPSGGISAVFSGLPSGSANFVVDVNVPGCTVISSNVVSLPDCGGGCTSVGATIFSNQQGNPPSLTICDVLPSPSTIILTCFATSSVSGAIFRFVQNGVIVQESTSNTLTVTFSQFASISLANYFCQVITQSGTCVGTQSNVISIQRCSGANPCATPGVPSINVVSGTICQLQTSQLQCIPAECASTDATCLAQFKYQLFRSSGFFVPGPTSSDFQFSNTFFVTALAGETFTCRVMRADTSCPGNITSVSSNQVFTSICT